MGLEGTPLVGMEEEVDFTYKKNKKRAMRMMVTMVQIIMRMMRIKGIITMLTLDSGGDGFRVDFTFDRTGGFT